MASLRPAAIVAAAFLLSACGGGGATPPTDRPQPPQTPSGPTANFTVSGTISQSGPQLFAHKRSVQSSRRAMLSFSKIVVNGTLYTGDAAAYPITSQTSIPVPTNGVYSASVPFSNVPVHNNQWVVLQFSGQAADGSEVSIGDLAGLVNVASGATNSATLTVSSTQTFQIFLDLVQRGFISTWDLDNEPTLASTLKTAITNAGGVPDSTTQLFDRSERLRLFNAIFPKYERDLAVTTAVAGELTVSPDYTNASEIDLASNVYSTSDVTQTGYYLWEVPAAAGGLMQIQPAGVPSSTFTPVIYNLGAATFSTTGGTQTIYRIYGGHLLLGATTTMLPFKSGLIHEAGRAMGTQAATIPVAASSENIAMSDQQGFAFTGDQQFQMEYHVHPNEALSNAPLTPMQWAAYSLPANYSATNNLVTVNTFTPYGLSAKDMDLCTPDDATCIQLNAASAGVLRGFYDDGSNLRFFNYSASGAATSISQGSGNYSIATGGSGTGTLTTTVPTAITPGQTLSMGYGAGGAIVSWTMTAYDANGKAYPAKPSQNTNFSESFQFDSVAQTIKATKIVFTFGSPGATTITWQPNTSAPYASYARRTR